MIRIDEHLASASVDTAFRVGADVERWPDILPHYRWVRFRDKKDFAQGIVEMAAWRPFGLFKYPTWWVSEMWHDRSRPAVYYRHVEGITRGMDVRWEFEEQQPPMTVRQMFYRMSSVGEVAKSEAGYRRVQYALLKMRRLNAIPYGWIADNTRWVRKSKSYSSMAGALTYWQKSYRRALWDNQEAYVEIWLEKDALIAQFKMSAVGDSQQQSPVCS